MQNSLKNKRHHTEDIFIRQKTLVKEQKEKYLEQNYEDDSNSRKYKIAIT
jgi:hypothetical protein